MIDALGGDRIAKWLWWLTNRPSLFVATTLVGNNLANYLVSLSIVIGTQALHLRGHLAEFVAPLALSPVIFVYGELLPKNLCYQAPYRLLRRGAPLFFFCGVLFAPFSAVLFSLGKLLEWVSGQSHQQLKLLLARRELQSVLEEGHEAGILRPGQRQLAQGLLAVANQRVGDFALPPNRLARVSTEMEPADVFRLARRHRLAALPVEQVNGGGRQLVGYVQVAELKVGGGPVAEHVRPLLELRPNEPHIAALVRLHNAGETMGRIVDPDGKTLGLVTAKLLAEPLFRGGR